MTTRREKVYRILSRLPRNRLATYKSLARKLGNARLSRAVGNWMHKNPYPTKKVPCFRVIKSNGEVGGYAGGTKLKIKKLRQAGFAVKNNKVVNYQKLIW